MKRLVAGLLVLGVALVAGISVHLGADAEGGPLSPTGGTVSGLCQGSGVWVNAGSSGSGSAGCFFAGNGRVMARLGSGLSFDGNGAIMVDPGSGGVGTVTSVATTGPITGGTITGSGTIACATCEVHSDIGGTSPNLQISTGAHTTGDFGGSGCVGAGSAVTGISPAGTPVCAAFVTGSAASIAVSDPLSNTSGTLGLSTSAAFAIVSHALDLATVATAGSCTYCSTTIDKYGRATVATSGATPVLPAALAGTATHVQMATGTSTLGDTPTTYDGAKWTVGTTLLVDQALALGGETADTLSGTQADNYTKAGLSTSSVLSFTVTSNTNISGIVAPALAGTILDLRNVRSSTGALTVLDETTSTSTNQIAGIGAQSWKLMPGTSMILRYNGTKWFALAIATYDFPTLIVDGALTVGGVTTTAGLTNSGGHIESGECSIGSLSGFGAFNNLAPLFCANPSNTYSVFDVQANGATITGLSLGQVAGTRIVLQLSTSLVILANQDSRSLSANRFLMPDGVSWKIETGATVSLLYNGAYWIPEGMSTTRFPVLTVDGNATVAGTLYGTGSGAATIAGIVDTLNAFVVGTTEGSGAVTDDSTLHVKGAVTNDSTTATVGLNNTGAIISEGNTCVIAAGSGTLDNNTPTCASGTAAASTVFDYTTNGVTTLDGLSIGQVTGTRVQLRLNNSSTNSITIVAQAAGSLAANRFDTPGTQNYLLAARASYVFVYNGTFWQFENQTANIPVWNVSGTSTFAGTATTSGLLAVNGAINLQAVVSPAALTTGASPYTDYTGSGGAPLTSSTTDLRQDVSSAAEITGISATQGNGRIFIIHNIATTAADTLTLRNDDGSSSTAANRFLFCNSVNKVLAAGASVALRWDSTSSRWRPIDGCAVTTLAALAANAVPKMLGGMVQGASSIVDNTTNVSTTEPLASTANGVALQLGDGTNVAVSEQFATARAAIGYDGAEAFVEASGSKPVAICSNGATPGGNTCSVVAAGGSTSVGIGGGITPSTLAGASVVVSSTTLANKVGLVIGNECDVTGGSGTVNDYAPSCASGTLAASATLDITTSATMQIDGVLMSQVTGSRLTVRNNAASTNGITISNANAGSLAANRFALPSAVAWSIPIGSTDVFLYNGTSWTMEGTTGAQFPNLNVTGTATLSSGTWSGLMTASSGVRLNGIATTNLTGVTQNDWNCGGASVGADSVLRATVAASTIVTGMACSQSNGNIVTLRNLDTTNTITLTNEDTGSTTAADRFTLCGGASLVIQGGGAVTLFYDNTSSRWRPIDQRCSDLVTSSAPTLTSCGSGATATGSMTHGGKLYSFRFVEGTLATGCTITFVGTSFTAAPSCTLTSEAGLVPIWSASSSAITLTNVGAMSSTAGDAVCMGP